MDMNSTTARLHFGDAHFIGKMVCLTTGKSMGRETGASRDNKLQRLYLVGWKAYLQIPASSFYAKTPVELAQGSHSTGRPPALDSHAISTDPSADFTSRERNNRDSLSEIPDRIPSTTRSAFSQQALPNVKASAPSVYGRGKVRAATRPIPASFVANTPPLEEEKGKERERSLMPTYTMQLPTLRKASPAFVPLRRAIFT